MEPLNTKVKSENKTAQSGVHKLKDMYRVIISKDAKLVLDDLLKKANDGFNAGEIAKSDIVNALLLNASKYFNEVEIKVLRSQHFDDAKALETLQREIAQGKAIPESVKVFLRSQYGLVETPKKRPSLTASGKPELPLHHDESDS
jgi:hypothetical protein